MNDTLRLVNKANPLPPGYTPGTLTAPLCGPGILLCQRAATMLDKCLEEAGAATAITATSGYRTNAEQTSLFGASLAENGEAFTRQFVALPGCSEHETGLAVDLAAKGDAIDPICPALPYDGVYGQFRALAPKYGFIERYPADKTGVTGIGHEPWHFRYVGWPHSMLMAQEGLVLEEYAALLEGHKGLRNALYWHAPGRKLQIFTEPAEGAAEITALLTRQGALWQAAAIGPGSVVVTVWQ